jgi:four helix bundle protein
MPSSAEPSTMPQTSSYKSLEVYQLAHRLGVDAHRFSLQLPKFELYETGSQLRRASKSISANIVEGYGRRRYAAEYVRFLIFAQASCDETLEWFEYARDCHDGLKSSVEELITRADELGRKLNKFIQAVEKRK